LNASGVVASNQEDAARDALWRQHDVMIDEIGSAVMSCDKATRRGFLKGSVIAGAALAVGDWATSPALASAAPPLELVDGKVSIKIADYADLSESYTATKLKVAGVGKLLLTRLEGDTYLAVSSKCTHQGCQVKWSASDKTFKCPCHESAFDLEGKPTGGPAEKPLPIFQTAFAEGVAVITIPEGFIKGDEP
jgi:Rieske Fe-S protein